MKEFTTIELDKMGCFDVNVTEEESSSAPACSIALPVIDDDLWDMFGETDLMTWDRENHRPHWTQTAVDLACALKCTRQ